MIINPDNLQRGLRKHKEWWPNEEDVRNSIYIDIYNDRAQGVTTEWWEKTVNRLSNWRANRPRSKEWIRQSGIRQLSRIREQYEKLISAKEEPCIINTQWTDIYQLFDIALAVKEIKSPVFASKLCHFIFSKLFIVIDNKATGISHYELFWRGLKDAWSAFEQKERAKDILFSSIRNGQDTRIHHNYPVETTIMEMCTIGYNHS